MDMNKLYIYVRSFNESYVLKSTFLMVLHGKLTILLIKKLCNFLQLFNYYSDETEEMAVDDIPEDILDQEDTELRTCLPQPILPANSTQALTHEERPDVDKTKMAQILAQF